MEFSLSDLLVKMSMFTLLDEAKEIVCLSGASGISWDNVLTQLSLSKNSRIADLILQKLRVSHYTIEEKDQSLNRGAPPQSGEQSGEQSSSVSSSSSAPCDNEILITAPVEDRCRAYGEYRARAACRTGHIHYK